MGPEGKLVLAFGSSGWCVGARVTRNNRSALLARCAASAAKRGRAARRQRRPSRGGCRGAR
jgi:hypothetical protein